MTILYRKLVALIDQIGFESVTFLIECVSEGERKRVDMSYLDGEYSSVEDFRRKFNEVVEEKEPKLNWDFYSFSVDGASSLADAFLNACKALKPIKIKLAKEGSEKT